MTRAFRAQGGGWRADRSYARDMAWLKRVWRKLTTPMAVRDDTRHGPQGGGPYGGPLK